jgi:hypothetical protein
MLGKPAWKIKASRAIAAAPRAGLHYTAAARRAVRPGSSPEVVPMLLSLRRLAFTATALALLAGAGPLAAAEVLVDGNFETQKNSGDLRKDGKGADWYESRKDGEGAKLLMLSTKDVGGNATKKAMLKAHPDLNTYLSQRLAAPIKVAATLRYDLFVREILPDDNRSAFCFLGGIKDKTGGPNSTGAERFVFLGCENAATPGKMNLFAREGANDWAKRTLVAKDLELGKWYTVVVDVNVAEGFYAVHIEGVTQPFELESFFTKGKTPSQLTHLSFATWNDGAGTFYVDEVSLEGN